MASGDRASQAEKAHVLDTIEDVLDMLSRHKNNDPATGRIFLLSSYKTWAHRTIGKKTDIILTPKSTRKADIMPKVRAPVRITKEQKEHLTVA